MSRYFYENGEQTIETGEILADIEKRLDEYDKRAALEGGELKPQVTIHCSDCGVPLERINGVLCCANQQCGNRSSKPAPTAATVEKYTVFEYSEVFEHRMVEGTIQSLNPKCFTRKPIGAVVATRKRHQWLVKLPSGVVQYLNDYFYRALVDMMLSSGVWERQV